MKNSYNFMMRQAFRRYLHTWAERQLGRGRWRRRFSLLALLSAVTPSSTLKEKFHFFLGVLSSRIDDGCHYSRLASIMRGGEKRATMHARPLAQAHRANIITTATLSGIIAIRCGRVGARPLDGASLVGISAATIEATELAA